MRAQRRAFLLAAFAASPAGVSRNVAETKDSVIAKPSFCHRWRPISPCIAGRAWSVGNKGELR